MKDIKDITEQLKRNKQSLKETVGKLSGDDQARAETVKVIDNIFSSIVDGSVVMKLPARDTVVAVSKNEISITSKSLTSIINKFYEIESNSRMLNDMRDAQLEAEARVTKENQLEGALKAPAPPEAPVLNSSAEIYGFLLQELPGLTKRIEKFTKLLDNVKLPDMPMPEDDGLDLDDIRGRRRRPSPGREERTRPEPERRDVRARTRPSMLSRLGAGLKAAAGTRTGKALMIGGLLGGGIMGAGITRPGAISRAFDNFGSLATSLGGQISAGLSRVAEPLENAYYRMSGNIRENFKNIMQIAASYGDPHPEITAAQWALESAYGSKMSGKNNPFGQKARKDRAGNPIEPATSRRTREVIGGRSVYINDWFRDYGSINEAIQTHVEKWTKRRTTPGTTPIDAARAIKAAGYATDPNYVNSLMRVLASNNIDPTKPFTSVEAAIQSAADSSLRGRIIGGLESAQAAVVSSAQQTYNTTLRTLGMGGFTPPVQQGRVTSGFGMRTHPTMGGTRMHTGVDYGSTPRGRAGAPILASAPGIVTHAAPLGGYGNLVMIDHGNGYSTRYGHLNSISVGRGQQVQQGQYIGGMGSTGRSTGVHLHFEIRKNGTPIDPLPLLNGATSPELPQYAQAATEPGMATPQQPRTDRERRLQNESMARALMGMNPRTYNLYTPEYRRMFDRNGMRPPAALRSPPTAPPRRPNVPNGGDGFRHLWYLGISR